jgi:hypothetical protein
MILKTCVIAGLIVLWSVDPSISARSETGQNDDVAVVETLAPVFLTPTSATPLRQLSPGTIVQILSTQDEWCRIEFNDRQLGRRTGFVRTRHLRGTKIASPPSPAPPTRDPQPNPKNTPGNATAKGAGAQNTGTASNARMAATLREPRLTNEVAGCRADIETVGKAVREASSRAQDAVRAQEAFEEIKGDLDDAVTAERRTCEGPADRSLSCSDAKAKVLALKSKLAEADERMRQRAIQLAEAVEEAGRTMSSTESRCNAAVGKPEQIPGVREHNQALCRTFMRMRDSVEHGPMLMQLEHNVLNECLKPASDKFPGWGLSPAECNICAGR